MPSTTARRFGAFSAWIWDAQRCRMPPPCSKFRHLLETAGLTKTIFETIDHLLRERGLLMNKGAWVDATLIAAPSSTKNQDHARDAEMGHTRKGQQYYFGAKAHIGVDAASGLVHSVTTTAANVADIATGNRAAR